MSDLCAVTHHLLGIGGVAIFSSYGHQGLEGRTHQFDETGEEGWEQYKPFVDSFDEGGVSPEKRLNWNRIFHEVDAAIGVKLTVPDPLEITHFTPEGHEAAFIVQEFPKAVSESV